MTPNHALWRALHSLTHPLGIAAIVVLLVNDHWLRHTHPSWFTGKLGDFTWLIFAPFIAATFFALIIPARHQRQEYLVAILGFGFIGLWFVSAKTVPIVNTITNDTANAIIGWQGLIRRDVTDLVTLPALLIGRHIWQHSTNTAHNLRPLVYAALALGIVATLASDGPPVITNTGVTTICESDSQLMIVTPAAADYVLTSHPSENINDPNMRSGYELVSYSDVFTSVDGGLTWRHQNLRNETNDIPACPAQSDVLIHPANPDIQYRWEAGVQIERSTDGGQTWVQVHDLRELRQEVRSHYNQRSETGIYETRIYRPGPLDATVDPNTGNTVFAMSWNGVLIHTADGQWVWSAVGERYQLAELTDTFTPLLFEMYLAIALAAWIWVTAVAYLQKLPQRLRLKAYLRLVNNSVRWFGIAVGGAGWLILNIFLLPLAHLEGDLSVALLSLILLVFVALPLMLVTIVNSIQQFRRELRYIVPTAILAGILYFLPFIPWAQGTIPSYRTASAFALLLAAGALLSTTIYLRGKFTQQS